MIAPMHRTPGAPGPAPGPPLLAGLPRPELDSLLARSVTRHLSPGALLFREGEEPKGLVVVREGAGEVFRAEPDGWGGRLDGFASGDVLAIASTLTGQRHLASARALVSTEILLVDRADVRRLCRRHPEIALRLRERMELRLSGLVRRLAGLATGATADQGAPRSLEMELSA